MKKVILALVSGIVLAFIAETATAQIVYLNNHQFDYVNGKWYLIYQNTATQVNHQVITVKFKDGVTNTLMNQLNNAHGMTVLRTNILGYYDLQLPQGVDPIATVQTYQANSLVEYVQPNTFGELFGDPNDPNFTNQWHHKHPQDRDIDTPEAWDIMTGNPNVIMAILDSGTDIDHQDLAGNIWINQSEANGTAGVDDDDNGFVDDIYGWNFSEGSGSNQVDQGVESVHGNHVAGVAGALTNNSVGVAGAAGGWGTSNPGAQLMTVCVGFLNVINMSVVDDAILYAAQNGYNQGKKVVINMSFGQGPSDPVVAAAIHTAYNTYGAFLVAATGNSNLSTVAFPANAANVFAVGASDKSDTRQTPSDPYFCTSTQPWGSNYGTALDVVAPGVDIWSTKLDNQYGCADGTSFAAPQVVGIAALLWSLDPSFTNANIESFIATTAQKVGGYSYNQTKTYGTWNNEMGYGRVNAHDAVLKGLDNLGVRKSTSINATAYNGSRKLAKNGNNLYLVYESGNQIYFTKSTNDGSSWSDPLTRLSDGFGLNNYPCITERSGKLYVVWQRKTGTNTYDILFRYFNGTSWETIKTVTSGVSVANDPLPVIASPNTSELMVVYRSGNNLEWKRSTNDGGAWPTSGTLNAGSGETLNSPSVGATITPWGAKRTGLAYATKEIPNASHIITRYHDGSAWSSSNNISSSLPGSLSQHAHPSLAPNGDATSPWYVHIAWDTYEYGNRVIIHRLASTADWNFGSQYYQLHYQTEDRPSISGLTGNTAHMVYNRGTNYYHLNAHFNGSGWSVQFPVISGFNPSLSVGNTSTKYVWIDGADSPYTINLSASSFQKPADSDSVFVDYHRSVSVVDTITGAWFDVQVEGMTITSTAGTKADIALIDVDPLLTITPVNAFDRLSSQSIVMPATAESLMVSFAISGDKLVVVKNNASPLRVELMIIEKSGNITNVPVFLTNVESLPKTKRNIALAASAFTDKEITLKPQVTGIATKSSLVASLGHIYEIIAVPTSKNVKKIADTATRQDFALKAYPNPFNPSTQIRFSMKDDGIATLRIYNLHGQLIRELLHERRAAGEHIVTWDGRDERGAAAASGVYFIRFEAGNEVQIGKIMLVR